MSDFSFDCPVTVFSRTMVFRADQMVSALINAGHWAEEGKDGSFKLTPRQILLLLGDAGRYPHLWPRLNGRPLVERPFVALWHLEPLPPPKASGLPRPRLHLREIVKILLRRGRIGDVYTNYHRLRRVALRGLPDLLLVGSLGRREFLAERGITACWVPFGYDLSFGHDMGLDRDVDVLFLGGLEVPRRRRLIKRLRRSGISLKAAGGWSNPEYWGESRSRLLNRTRILLNFPRNPGELSGLRFVLGMANGALIISEPIYEPAPFVPGKHFISASPDRMPEIIRYYLSHEDERKRIATAGNRLVTREVTMERSVRRILELVDEHARE